MLKDKLPFLSSPLVPLTLLIFILVYSLLSHHSL
jgi:hypothetical protein